MVFVKNWEDFEIAAENMYMSNPSNCRYTMKYVHSKGHVVLKMTDNVKVHISVKCSILNAILKNFQLQCVQYKAENMPDLKKIEKFSGNLMGHMASKE